MDGLEIADSPGGGGLRRPVEVEIDIVERVAETGLAGSDQAAAILDHSIDDAAAAITEALKTPGRSVAVFPLATLLRKNGVLDRLGVEGARISSPDY
jgi:hypothetical protein